jgi:hypothetical protein
MASPLLGLGTAVLLTSAAGGARRANLMPRWWAAVSVGGAVLASCAAVSFGKSGFFYPDVQQQSAGHVVLTWFVITGMTLRIRAIRRLAAARRERRATPTASTERRIRPTDRSTEDAHAPAGAAQHRPAPATRRDIEALTATH